MPQLSLPRSFKRKYKKMHGQFTTLHSATTLLEDDLKVVTSTALKLIAENDILLDLLSELRPGHTPISVTKQLSRASKENGSTVDGNTNGDFMDDEYYLTESPEHFASLPWDLDLYSVSGSYLEDLRDNAVVPFSNPQIQETPTASSAMRKSSVRVPSSKKRERNDAEDDANGTSIKKKKKKSALTHNNDSWTP